MKGAKKYIAYREIENLLTQLGFIATERDNGVIAYHYAEADSLILLPPKRGDRQAREADLLSVSRHLIGRGHLGEVDFEEFRQSGKLRASTT